MTIYHIILFGPPVAAMLALVYLLAWGLIAPGLAWQNVQEASHDKDVLFHQGR